MVNKYILHSITKNPIVEDDLIKWAKWFETADRCVAEDVIGIVKVSTVFLGLDHRFVGEGRPILFETMVFNGKYDQEEERYSTWEEAELGHKVMCKKVFNNRDN